VHDEPSERVVVARFDVRFTDPPGQIGACDVLDLDDEPVTMDADACDVAAVLAAGLDAPVDTVVVEGSGEVVSDGPFEATAGGLG
jgi:hypothetical protein